MKRFLRKAAAVLAAAAVSAGAFTAEAYAANEGLKEITLSFSTQASVSKPTYMVKGSTGYRKVKLKTSTSGATIYYTTNGSTPTTNSNVYTGLIKITKNTTFKAIAVKNGQSSAVMSKTIRIKTLPGDVTGDGNVNENDYKRLKSWLTGGTSYGIKDNADVSGNGKVNSADLKYIRRYLDGEIDDFPASGKTTSSSSGGGTSSSLKQPTMTVYKVYGGMKIELATETSGATMYYTTNGSNPTTSSQRYTGTFIIDRDADVKAVAYKDGSYSTVKSRAVSVDTCSAPVSSVADSQNYNDSVKITLSSSTSGANIYYTTDGSDPIRYGTLYKGEINLTGNTTLKAYANAKGCANSAVSTWNYKVASTNYTISGVVWNDTEGQGAKADGLRQSNEPGINGITVKLINNSTGYADQTVTTARINGVDGSYILDKAKAGTSYKVAFEFNGMKFRAYPTIVSGGNQATAANPADITIKNAGAYNSGNQQIAAVNSYSAAAVSSAYNMTAQTNSNYTASATNVNLALMTNVYGDLNLSFAAPSINSLSGTSVSAAQAGQQVFGGDTVTYYLTAKNDSPAQKLNSAILYFYIAKDVDLQDIRLSSGVSASYSFLSTENNGLQKYSVTCPAIDPGQSVVFSVSVKVKSSVADRTPIICYAEVAEYTFSGSCYDLDSVPGNLIGYAVRETDEAATIQLLGYEDITASQSIAWDPGNDLTSPIGVGQLKKNTFTIKNGKSISDFVVTTTDSNVFTYEAYPISNNGDLQCTLLLTGKTPGTTTVFITLKKDSAKSINMTVTVQ